MGCESMSIWGGGCGTDVSMGRPQGLGLRAGQVPRVRDSGPCSWEVGKEQNVVGTKVESRSGPDHVDHEGWATGFELQSIGMGLSMNGFWRRQTQSLFCLL